MPTRVLVAVGIVVALLLAGGLSVYASTRPDGLQRVAADHGFAEQQRENPTSDGPMAGYRLGDADNPRAAGVLGALVVLVLASGLTFAIRRRGRTDGSG